MVSVRFDGLSRFIKRFKAFSINAENGVIDTKVKYASGALYTAIQATPFDEGDLRGNWQVGINSPITQPIDRQDITGLQVYAAENEKIVSARTSDRIYITNNSDYFSVVDEGLYDPKNPGPSRQSGSRWKGFIRVENGYSTQAPEGILIWVRNYFERTARTLGPISKLFRRIFGGGSTAIQPRSPFIRRVPNFRR